MRPASYVLCKNVQELLVRSDWRNYLLKAREQLPKAQDGDTPLPLAEVIIQASKQPGTGCHKSG